MKDQGRRRKFLVYTCALAFTTLVAFAILVFLAKGVISIQRGIDKEQV